MDEKSFKNKLTFFFLFLNKNFFKIFLDFLNKLILIDNNLTRNTRLIISMKS
jgi:hypothetical protein